MKLGFVGLGSMGRAIAGSLLDAGHDLAIYNRTRERGDALHERGARIAETPAEAATGAAAVFSMLADDAAVEAVTFGSAGIIAGLAPGAVHVSSSTISVAFSERLEAAHTAAEQSYVSAPVFGRPEAAAAKQLWVIAAGDPVAVEKCLPLFEAIGRGVTRFGDKASTANLVKLAGNFLIVSMLESLGEAFALTRKAGVSPNVFLDLFVNVFAHSPIFENYAKVIAKEAYEPAGMKMALGLKDIHLALEAGERLQVPLPFASVMRDHFLTALAQGKGELDWSGIAQVAAERAGLK